MIHTDHVNLIRAGVIAGLWADFGAGAGAFTLALADLLGSGAHIYAIDRDSGALDQQRKAMQRQFPDRAVTYLKADFTQKLELPPLDGALMANSLHFVKQKEPVLSLIRGYLKPGGRLILVEYDTDRGNMWLPHPFSFETWRAMASRNGFKDTRLLARWSGSSQMYSALSFV